MKKPKAKREVARLVSKLDSLTKREFKKYDEENTKKDFILPLFRALGWAIEDRREVTAEDKVSRRRVDYAFRIEGIPKFFLEAKRLKADLDNPEYAWQAINYAWTKGVTWAVLTDFEGLKVYNAQWKGPSLLYNRFLEIAYTEYLERFDELWLLSRESFEKGLLDIEAEKVGKKGRREAVGKELFDDLIVWRQRLYGQLRGWKENKRYSAAQIDEAVQRILDRFIFIRTAEDRELEERVLLPAVREWRENGRRKELDNALVRIFRQFDEKYDSELFEVGHFCEDLVCDSTTYAWVIEGLYGMRDEVPTYNFDAIDVDVLGGIYEQYLSYRQGLPEEVEEAKRRRRKKRGIYYTPKFVVEYIVENTVGRLLQERSHDEIRKLRILDPACGSGSFLIEAFDRLDRYHQEARGTAQRSDEKAARDDFLERLRILRDNIYGVDLDPQAVEIARLNLLLKTLHRRALLPKLEDNIRCGNSLISGMPIELSQYFGADWEAKRPFNWEEEFSKIMEEGGFDVVIGNPPYVRNRELDSADKMFFKQKFRSAKGQYDLYQLFFERAIELLKEGGFLGFITSNKYTVTAYGEALRKYILDHCSIVEILDVSEIDVFKDAATYPFVIILRKEHRKDVRDATSIKVTKVRDERSLTDPGASRAVLQGQFLSELGFAFNIYVPVKQLPLLEKMEKNCFPLGEISLIREAIHTGNVRAKVLFGSRINDKCEPVIGGRDCARYGYPEPKMWILYDPSVIDRSKGEYGNFPDRKFFDSPKLVIRDIALRLTATYDKRKLYCLNTLYSLILTDSLYDLKYVLGVLNSQLMQFYFSRKYVSSHVRGGYLRFKPMFTNQLPIRRIDFENPQDVKMHDDLVAIVERMLDLHKRLKDAKGEEKKNLERQIARTDRKIDNLVYDLYGITEEERKIMEAR